MVIFSDQGTYLANSDRRSISTYCQGGLARITEGASPIPATGVMRAWSPIAYALPAAFENI